MIFGALGSHEDKTLELSKARKKVILSSKHYKGIADEDTQLPV